MYMYISFNIFNNLNFKQNELLIHEAYFHGKDSESHTVFKSDLLYLWFLKKLQKDAILRFSSLVETLKTLSGWVELSFSIHRHAQVETTTKQRARDNRQCLRYILHSLLMHYVQAYLQHRKLMVY